MSSYYKVEWMTQEFLKETFTYCESGNLIWRHDRPLSHFASVRGYKNYMVQRAGIIAGKIAINERPHPTRKPIMDVRTVQVSFEGEKVEFKLHRLIFLYHNGFSPKLIDHIDGNYLNNKIENLQPINHQLNIVKSALHTTNKTSYRGVGVSGSKFLAQINLTSSRGKTKLYLGTYDTAEEAAMVYNYVNNLLYGDYAFQNKISGEVVMPELKAPVFVNGTLNDLVEDMVKTYGPERKYEK